MSEQAATNLETLPELQARVFNRLTRRFEPLKNAVVVTLSDILADNPKAQLEDIEPDIPVFVAVNLYDIRETMRRTLHQLAKRRPGCFAVIFGDDRKVLEYVVKTNPGVQLLAATTLPPDEVQNVPAWQQAYAAMALDVGCDGVVVNAEFDCSELAECYPDRQFIQLIVLATI